MTALQRKLLRDLRHTRTQALAIALVIACGVATFVMSRTAHRSLAETQARYYEEYGFAHVFTRLKRAPRALVRRIAELPGVARVQSRVVVDVTLDLPGMIEPAIGRLISVPDYTPPTLNRLHLRTGRPLDPERRGEVLANEAFAVAHDLRPGDTLRAVINGKLELLTIVGIALSPEYIYQIRPGELFPDDRRFGVLWMADSQLAAAFDLTDAFNDLTLTLMRGASSSAVLRDLDRLTAAYGGQGAYLQEDQLSNRYVSDELMQLRTTAFIPPTIFLAVAAFILNVVLNRLVTMQREQIAALKAFGYGRWEIGRHYGQFALVIVFTGIVLGAAVGSWMGRGLTAMYTQFFRFPVMDYRFAAEPVLTAGGLAVLAGGLGVVTAVLRAVRLPPAEAMRPEPPGAFRSTVVERLGLRELFSQTWRMILRQVERRPVRPLLSVLGIALAVAIMILGSFSKDLVDFIVEFQFFTAQRQELTVAFVEPANGRALDDLTRLPGVLRAEPFRSVPVRLRAGHRDRLVGIMGLGRGQTLFRVLDESGRRVSLPPHGMVLSEKLASLLGVKPGDRLTVEVLEGQRPVRELVVAATVRDFVGNSAYMDLADLHRFLHEGDAISGAFLDIDPQAAAALHARLKATPRVASVASQRAALRSFERTMSENILRMRLFNIAFASIIAFGVVYNSARIALSEHSRDLATLRVLGFTRGEISAILLGEVGLLTVVAIPLGMLAGYGMAAFFVTALETESQRFPLVVAPATYAHAVLVVGVAAIFSGLVVQRRIATLDLVAVLKARD